MKFIPRDDDSSTETKDDTECPHGMDRAQTTNSGLPKCPMCRRRVMKARRNGHRETPKSNRPIRTTKTPRVDVAALAAHDESLF